MLRSRLNHVALSVAGVLVLAACAGVDGTERGAIRENVIEPGISAIDESRTLACGADAATLRTALEAYELIEGEPAPDESALVTEGFLRDESDAWDVTDGQIVSQDPQCGAPPAAAPAAEIVTDSEIELLSVDEMLATFTADDIAEVGGPECARELSVIFSGAARYVAETGLEPGTLAALDDAGYLEEPVTSWEVVGDAVRPIDGSGCIDFVAGVETADR